MNLIGNNQLRAFQSAAMASGKYFECYDLKNNLLIPTSNLTLNYSFECDVDLGIVFEDVINNSSILSPSGELKTQINFFLSNSLTSGGFAIAPGTGTILNNTSSLNGKFVNEKPKVIIKKDPTITGLPANPEFIFSLGFQRKITSGNTVSSDQGRSLFFNQIRFVSVPKGQQAIIQIQMTNLEGANFNIDQLTNFFFIEPSK